MVILTVFLVISTILTAKTASDQLRIQQQPVILREGLILGGWESLQGVGATSSLRYKVDRNFATDIHGEIIFNNQEYPLLIALRTTETDGRLQGTQGLEHMGWASPGMVLLVYPDWQNGKARTEANKIHLYYRDLSGIQYCSREDSSFTQIIDRC